MSFVLATALEHTAQKNLPSPLGDGIAQVIERVRYGCFQRSLSLLVATTSVASGLEVGYEHYKGSYSNPVMYTPVILSGALAGAGLIGSFSRWGAKVILRAVSALTFLDGVIGFFFHVRGISRKPGGWSLPVTNIVMGPPLFAPLLFGTSAYLGLMASYLRREEDYRSLTLRSTSMIDAFHKRDWRSNLHHGRFQRHLSAITVLWAFFSGFEALYSHYKTNFRYKAQWTPIILTPILMLAGIRAMKSRRVANTILPSVSMLALADGAIGTYYHVRGILRRPGGLKKPLYNTLYGPPVFAPLLFAACGFLGILASILRREPGK